MQSVYHISEDPNIQRFDPRPPPTILSGNERPCVWAIDAQHLPNYLLPRDCPRVTFHAKADTNDWDIQKHLGGDSTRNVVAIESAWLEAAMHTPIYQYELNADSFEVMDEGSGYCLAFESLHPLSKQVIPNPLLALASRSVEIRILPELWMLRDAVFASTLQYSFIRMRNAKPRPQHA
jgi:hypothetical protein